MIAVRALVAASAVALVLAAPPARAAAPLPSEASGLSPEALRLNDEATADTALTNRTHAAVLLDEQSYRLREDGSASMVVHRAVRVHTPYGRAHYRMVLFQYNALIEQPRMEFAGARLPNGQWASTGAAGVRDTLIESVSPHPFYHNLRQYVYVLPDPQPGTIIEYQYVIERERQPLPGEFELRIDFSTEDPVMKAHRTLIVPAALDLHLFAGAQTPAPRIETANGERRYDWEATHFPGIFREYAQAPTDPARSVLVTTISTWRELATQLAKDYDEAARPTPEIKELVRTTIGAKTGEAAQRAIYNLVAGSVPAITFNDFEVTGVRPDPAATVWQNRAADGKDHATLLGACLRAGGFPVTFALANLVTVPDTSAPSLLEWNHVLVKTTGRGGRTVWLDSATETAPFGVLSGTAQGKVVLPLRASGPLFERTPILPVDQTVDLVTLDLTIDEKGNLSGTMRSAPSGVAEMQQRRMLKKAGRANRRKFFSERIIFIAPNGKIMKYDISPAGDLSVPFGVGLTIDVPKWGRVVNDTIAGLLPPGFTSYPTAGLAQWVWETERKTPLDVSVLARAFTIEKRYTVHIPEGYRVGVLRPQPIQNSVGSFSASWTLSGQVVHLTEVLKIEKSWITPDIYPELRTLWFAIGEFESQPLRLVKKRA